MATTLANQTRHAGVVQSIEAGQARIAVAVQGCASCGQQKSCGVGKLAGGAVAGLMLGLGLVRLLPRVFKGVSAPLSID